MDLVRYVVPKIVFKDAGDERIGWLVGYIS
jgi:hypothetical protein